MLRHYQKEKHHHTKDSEKDTEKKEEKEEFKEAGKKDGKRAKKDENRAEKHLEKLKAHEERAEAKESTAEQEMEANGDECLFLEGLGVEDSVVVQICWFSAVCLGVVVVHEDLVVAVLRFYVDVVGLAELLEVEAFYEMLVDELQDFLRVEEADAADIYQVLDKYSILVALGLFLWPFAAPVRLVEQWRAF